MINVTFSSVCLLKYAFLTKEALRFITRDIFPNFVGQMLKSDLKKNVVLSTKWKPVFFSLKKKYVIQGKLIPYS